MIQLFAVGNTDSVHWSFFKTVNFQSTENIQLIDIEVSIDFGG